MNEAREPGDNLPPQFLPKQSAPGSSMPARDPGDSNRLLRRLAWALAAIGVVGFGIWAAQKHFFNNADDKPAPISESRPEPTPPQTPGSVPQDKEKPTPAPSPQASVPVPQASVPPTTDQQQNPDSHVRTDPPAPGPSGDHAVAFVTDPPGATVTVDMKPDLSCRTPCLLTLPAGRHVLKAKLEGYRDYPKIITVPQDNDLFMKLNKALGSLVLP